jgi:hypothetical protein
MVTAIEYALLTGASYHDTRADLNRFPIPAGWSVISLVPEDQLTGFEASAYRNSLTNDIVISYAGTDPDDISGDIAADIGLALEWDPSSFSKPLNTTCKSRLSIPMPLLRSRVTVWAVGWRR